MKYTNRFLVIMCAIVLLSIANKQLQAQNWAETGTQWVYDLVDLDPVLWNQGYVKFESIKDTLIALPDGSTQNCKVLSRYSVVERYDGVISTYFASNIYTYATEDRVYILKKHNFATLYNFAAQVGDTWPIPIYNVNTIPDECAPGVVEVYAKGDTLIGGQMRRYIKLRTLTEQSLALDGLVIEGIGNTTGAFLPRNMCHELHHQAGGVLRCYSDANISIQMHPGEPCEYLGVDEDVLAQAFKTYPNPVSKLWHIELQQLQHANLQIYDITGKKVLDKQVQTANSSIDVSRWPQGIYSYELQSGKHVKSGKLIVQ